MRVLVTGGNGSVGRDLVPALLDGGNEVVVLDRDVSALRTAGGHRPLELIEGSIEDGDAVAEAVRGADAVVHLAWSFADAMQSLIRTDLCGEQLLLEQARAENVHRFVVASSAVVYGRPPGGPIAEGDSLRPLRGRKPAYGLAKEFAEKLALLADATGGPQAVIFRFWWAFGSDIGGRHLRDMLRAAASGEPVRVPAGCGGSFLSAEDLARAVALALSRPEAKGAIFNLSSAYVTWEEIARMVVDVVGARTSIEVIDAKAWNGAAFLNDSWQLDDALARRKLGYRPARDAAGVRMQLRHAIARTWGAMERS